MQNKQYIFLDLIKKNEGENYLILNGFNKVDIEYIDNFSKGILYEGDIDDFKNGEFVLKHFSLTELGEDYLRRCEELAKM